MVCKHYSLTSILHKSIQLSIFINVHNVSDSADTLVMASNLSLLLGEKPNQPSSSFKFPKTKFGKEEKKDLFSQAGSNHGLGYTIKSQVTSYSVSCV